MLFESGGKTNYSCNGSHHPNQLPLSLVASRRVVSAGNGCGFRRCAYNKRFSFMVRFPWAQSPADSNACHATHIVSGNFLQFAIKNNTFTGWWYTYPFWKMMEFVTWDYEIPNWCWKVIQNSMVPVTTKQFKSLIYLFKMVICSLNRSDSKANHPPESGPEISA